MDKTCENCNAWKPMSDKPLEIKGYCYKVSDEPIGRDRDYSCLDWQEYEMGVLG